MKRLGSFVASISVLLGLVIGAHPAPAAPIDELLAAAKKENVLELLAPSSLTPLGAQALSEAFNQKYGLNTRVNFHASSNMVGDIGKVVGFAAAGVTPEWDLMLVTDSHHGTLWLRKLHTPYNYKSLGIDARAIHYDSGAISFAHQIVLPAYKKGTLSAQDIPKRWEDLLGPKWKGGKLGMSTATHHLARLAAGPWGEKKTTEFVKALATQQLFLGTLAELSTRLQLGEILIAVTFIDQFIYTAQIKGVPLTLADGVEPVVAPAWHAGVLRNAPHPSAAHLFTFFLTAPEGQKVWEKFTGGTSAFVPGTKTSEYMKGKQAVYMTQDQAKTIDRLTGEYGKILGFTK